MRGVKRTRIVQKAIIVPSIAFMLEITAQKSTKHMKLFIVRHPSLAALILSVLRDTLVLGVMEHIRDFAKI